MVINFDSLLTLNEHKMFFFLVFACKFFDYLHVSINCGAIELNYSPRPLTPPMVFQGSEMRSINTQMPSGKSCLQFYTLLGLPFGYCVNFEFVSICIRVTRISFGVHTYRK